MTSRFDPAHMAAFFDDVGEGEWQRHDNPAGRVSVAVHVDLLRDFVHAGDLVLDAGAGPGKFTVEIAALGARVHVGDLSPVQLEANRQRVDQAGWEGSVVAREVLDICDLSHLPSGRFDVVVCFGGPLSYVRDRANVALGELVRVTRPGGHVLLSVMSTLGSMRAYLEDVLVERRQWGPDYPESVFRTGELDRERNRGHEMRMFRWSQLRRLCAEHGEVVAAAAANFLTAGSDRSGALADLTDDEWAQILSWERRLCREPGVLDGSTHMLVALRTPP